uniref:Knottin scorpion toxin-like domain-containing protein n=1 Tax=Cucumis sativus TaxID=3659 RepID=A0A0A0KYP7_CUCSA
MFLQFTQQNQACTRTKKMANLSSFRVAIIIVIFAVSMILVPQGTSALKCQDRLYVGGCIQHECGQKCSQLHHGGTSKCISTDPTFTKYACYCFYNCPEN